MDSLLLAVGGLVTLDTLLLAIGRPIYIGYSVIIYGCIRYFAISCGPVCIIYLSTELLTMDALDTLLLTVRWPGLDTLLLAVGRPGYFTIIIYRASWNGYFVISYGAAWILCYSLLMHWILCY